MQSLMKGLKSSQARTLIYGREPIIISEMTMRLYYRWRLMKSIFPSQFKLTSKASADLISVEL